MTHFPIILDVNLAGRERTRKMKNRWSLSILTVIVFAFGMMMQTNAAQAKKRTFTVNPKTIPCSSVYRQKPYYNKKTKQYYMIASYMNRLSKTGGTLKLKKGTYMVPGTIYVPSNVKIICSNGVKIKKTSATGTKKMKATKFLFQAISEEKATRKQSAGKYAASKNVVLQGNGKTVIDMGKIAGATAFFAGHASNVKVSGIQFKNKKGGSYVWIEGSKNVTVSACSFERKVDVSGLKNRMDIRLETCNKTTSDFSGKWSKQDNTVNKKIKIQNNRFSNPDIGVGTVKSVVTEEKNAAKEYYQTGITIDSNTFTDTKKTAVYAVLWKKPQIKKNVVKRSDKAKRASAGVMGFGVNEPSFSGNKISGCTYAMTFDTAKNNGKGKKFPSVMSVVGTNTVNKIAATQVDDLGHYYVLNQKNRILYFQNKLDKNFTITTATKPYHEKYDDASDFTKRKIYYTFLSYMEQLEYAGGGTITVKAGNYEVTNNICIPSNVTIKFENGVTFTKAGTTATDICYAKSIFTIVPPSKDGTIKTISGYNGSHDVKLIGAGVVRLNCANVKNCMALVMGHARNVTIEGITFQNEYGSHFMELNSSENVTIQKCTFEGFKVLDKKSYKECINVDGTDLNTDGFNYDWSAHDKTTCKNILIQNTTFKNIGTAIGSHTYSANGQTQLYHENVKILNNTFDGTYNAAIRALNWRNTVIQGNSFLRIQALSDGVLNSNGNQTKYVAVLLRGVVNPTVTANVFEDCGYYPIRVVMRDSASVAGAVKAGYGDTISNVTEANWLSMQKNTLTNVAKKYQYIIVRENNDQADSEAQKKAFLQ